MCHQPVSPLNVVAFILLLISSAACAICFGAPFWITYPHAFKPWKVADAPPSLRKDILQSIAVAWKGMLANCLEDTSCTWFWQNNYDLEKNLPEWYKASQGAFVAALGALGFAVLLQSIYSCCRCCKNPCSFPTVVASFCVAGAILAGLGLGLFGGFAYKNDWFDSSRTGGFVAKLDWAFYTGIGGACGAFLAAILFFFDGCCVTNSYRGYSPPSKS